MKTLILYDSLYGNTHAVAAKIAQGFKPFGDTKLLRVADAHEDDVFDADVIIAGSPTQAGRATNAMQDFLAELPQKALSQKFVAAFDTRFATNTHGFGLKIVMKTLGFAAPRIARALVEKHGILLAEPKGFIVQDKEGPLESSQLTEARDWAKMLAEKSSQLEHVHQVAH